MGVVNFKELKLPYADKYISTSGNRTLIVTREQSPQSSRTLASVIGTIVYQKDKNANIGDREVDNIVVSLMMLAGDYGVTVTSSSNVKTIICDLRAKSVVVLPLYKINWDSEPQLVIDERVEFNKLEGYIYIDKETLISVYRGNTMSVIECAVERLVKEINEFNHYLNKNVWKFETFENGKRTDANHLYYGEVKDGLQRMRFSMDKEYEALMPYLKNVDDKCATNVSLKKLYNQIENITVDNNFKIIKDVTISRYSSEVVISLVIDNPTLISEQRIFAEKYLKEVEIIPTSIILYKINIYKWDGNLLNLQCLISEKFTPYYAALMSEDDFNILKEEVKTLESLIVASFMNKQ